jgi:hypothetical protein
MKSAPKDSKNMAILFDTNVVLDVLLERQPWHTEAALIFGFSEKNLSIVLYLHPQEPASFILFKRNTINRPLAILSSVCYRFLIPPT